MSELTDEKLSKIEGACMASTEAGGPFLHPHNVAITPKLGLRLIRTIREQRAEIERLEGKAEMVEETIGAYLAADSSKRNICELIALVDPTNDQ